MKRGLRPHTMTFCVRLPVGEPVKPHNLLIPAHNETVVCTLLRCVLSILFGAAESRILAHSLPVTRPERQKRKKKPTTSVKSSGCKWPFWRN
jgi:hypothetical protein